MQLRLLKVIAIVPVALLFVSASPGAQAPQYSISEFSPTAVQPSADGNYMTALKNMPTSGVSAAQAQITLPAGFVVDAASIGAATIATDRCTAATWTATLGDDGTIQLQSPDDSESELCPGATLTVTWHATAPAAEGIYAWTTSLSRDSTAFQLKGSDPTTTVDGTPPPAPAITSAPANPSNTSSASFAFSNSEDDVQFLCQLDGGGFGACVSPQAYSSLGQGAHTFDVKAEDAAGNESDTSSYTWTIDTEAPPTPAIESGPPDPSGSSSAEFRFSDTEAAATDECQLDGGGFSPCSSPQPYTDLSDGSHTFEVRALDGAGNRSDPAAYTWTIDTVNPVATLDDKPSGLTNQTTATFSFSSQKSGSTFQCKLDDAAFAACTSPKLYAGLNDGSHTFAVQATSLGRTGPTTAYAWTVDTIAPETTIGSGPGSASTSTSATFTFTSSEAGSTFACRIDVGGLTSCSSPQTYANLTSGAHTFHVQAVDAAGNADPTPATYTWQVTATGPTIVDRTPPGNVGGLKRNVGYGVLTLIWKRPPDADFDHVTVFASTSPAGPPLTVVYQGAGTTYTDTHFRNGVYYRYTIISYDHAGNASAGVGLQVPAGALLHAPRDGAVVRRPPLLSWQQITRAKWYNVQLYYGGQKVLSAWPTSSKLELRRSWVYAGRRFQLRKGQYRWYVWPGFGARSKPRYGQLVGQATFRVR